MTTTQTAPTGAKPVRSNKKQSKGPASSQPDALPMIAGTTTRITLKDAFPNAGFAGSLSVPGNHHPQAKTPDLDPFYVFDPHVLFDIITFFTSGEKVLKLIGHTGTGKSSHVEQVASRLNLDLFVVTASPSTRAAELFGGLVPTEQGGLRFKDGPVLQAAREGKWVLIDEYNVIDAGEATGLNGVMEGRMITIPETGEVVKPAPGFKMFLTQNLKTAGYRGRNNQDLANDDRCAALIVNYMPAAAEIVLISAVLSEYLADKDVIIRIAETFVSVANKVRSRFMGESDDPDALEVTMSTRTLIRWVRWFGTTQGIEGKFGFRPIHYALERALTNKCQPATRLAIHAVVQMEFGDEHVTPQTRFQQQLQDEQNKAQSQQPA